MVNWYMKGQSDYLVSNFHMAFYMDMNGFPEANYDSQDIEGDGESGDPFMAFAIDTQTWTYGSQQVEFGLLSSYRFKADSTGLYGWNGSGWTDLLAAGGAENLGDLTDVVISTPGDNEVLAWDNGTSKWINQTPAEAGLSTSGHSHGQLHDQNHDNTDHTTNYEAANANIQTHVGSPGEDVHHPKTHDNTEHSTNYEPAFSKNTGFNKNFGVITGTVAQGDDSRFHTPTVAGDLNLNELAEKNHASLANKNAETDFKHLTDAQQSALHAIYTLQSHNNTYHSTNYHSEADGTGAVTVHSDVSGAGSGVIISTAERNALHSIYTLESHNNTYHSTNYLANISEDITPEMLIEDALASDGDYQGIILTITNAQTFGLAVYISANNTVALADKDSISTMPPIGLSVGSNKVLMQGSIREDDWDWTAGDKIYVGDSGALINDISGFTQGDIAHCIGVAIDPNTISVKTLDWVEVADNLIYHNSLAGLNAGDSYEHLSQTQVDALHTIYSLESHNNTYHSTNYHTEAAGTGVATVHSDITTVGSGNIITTGERNALHTIYSLEQHDNTYHSTNYEVAFSKNTAFNKDFGTLGTEVCVGNDSRLSDARTPVSHNNTYHSTNYEPAFTKNTAFNKDFGTLSTEVCVGDDSRLSDARTPSAHVLNTSGPHTGPLQLTDLGSYAAQGDLMFGGVSDWGVLSKGTSGKYLKAGATTISWEDVVAAAHKTSHQNAGGDEIDVGGLSGLLADGQTPVSHNNTYHSATYLDAAGVQAISINNLSEDGSPQLDADLDLNGNSITVNGNLGSDHTYEGMVLNNITNTQAFGKLVYITSAHTTALCDKDSVVLAIGISVGTGEVLYSGTIRDDSFSGLAAGNPVYVGDDGNPTDDISGYTAGDMVQCIGVAIDTNMILIKDICWVEVA